MDSPSLLQIADSRSLAPASESDGSEAPQTDGWRFMGIPTDDPTAALQFCRALASTLATWNIPEEAAIEIRLDGVKSKSEATPDVPELSIVIPIYNEEQNLPILSERLSAVMDKTAVHYEIVFVDDGSGDGSSQVLQALAGEDSRVVVVELARNFGHQVAISAGIDFARGKAVIVMDGDLQDPPEVLPDLIEKWRQGFDVVYGVRKGRKESWPMRIAYAGFYRLLHRAANIDIPLDAGDFCIMDRKVVEILKSMPERNRFVRGIRSWVGFCQTGLEYERHARNAGQPKYTMSNLTSLAVNGFVSFSHLPLRVATLFGFAISLLSFVLAAFYFVKRILFGLSPPGFATLVVAIFFLAGIQLITIGVIGEYVGRIFDEVKQRPLYVIRRVIREKS